MKPMMQGTMVVLFGLVACLVASHVKDKGMHFKHVTATKPVTELTYYLLII